MIRKWVDPALALALVAAAEYHVWSGGAPGPRAVTAVCGAAIAGSVALRRRAPLLAVAIAMTATVAQSLLASPPQAPWLIATWVILFFSSGLGLVRNRALLALAIGLVGAAVDESQATDRSAAGFAFALVALVLVPWFAGRAISTREQRVELVERESEESTRRALEAERGRIARDLHDVVAHAVSLIVLQAEAGAAVLDADPERTRRQLASIQHTGRQALGEMTRLLGVLRTDEQEALRPQPSIAQLSALVDDVRGAGLAVDVRVEGDARPLEPGVDLTVYRVVQEALTNALKYARRATVVLRYTRDAVVVEVRSAGATPRNGHSSGHGLIGMRERVALYGGTLQVGADDDGGFAVEAVVPA